MEPAVQTPVGKFVMQRMLRKIERIAKGLGRAASFGNRTEIENGDGNHRLASSYRVTVRS